MQKDFRILQNFHTCRKNRLLIQNDTAVFQPLLIPLLQRLCKLYKIGLFNMMLRREQTMRQLTVICNQQQALRIHVQSANRKTILRQKGINTIQHGFINRITRGTDNILRLVQHDIDNSLIIDFLSINTNDIHTLLDFPVVLLAEFSIDTHSPLANCQLDLLAGTQSRMGQIFIQSHIPISFFHAFSIWTSPDAESSAVWKRNT